MAKFPKFPKFPPMPPEVIEAMSKRQVDIGRPFGKCDLHHAIISRAMAVGLPNSERAKIHDPRNLLKVEHGIHLYRPLPSPQEAAKMLYAIYGYKNVLEWWNSVEWRSHPPFFLPDED